MEKQLEWRETQMKRKTPVVKHMKRNMNGGKNRQYWEGGFLFDFVWREGGGAV